MVAGKKLITYITIKESFDFIDEAWQQVTEKTFSNCCKKCNILPTDLFGEEGDEFEKDFSELDILLRKVCSDFTAKESCNIDIYAPNADELTDKQIINSILIENELSQKEAELEEDEEEGQ